MVDVIQVRYLVLCEYADNAGGKHYISGAGVSNLQAVLQSAALVIPSFGIALAIDVPYGAMSGQHTIRVQVEDEDGTPVLPQPVDTPLETGRPPGMRHGNWLTAKLAFNVQPMLFPKEGIYSVVVDIDGAEATRQNISVVKAPSMQMAENQPG